jgi:hypothetical protein
VTGLGKARKLWVVQQLFSFQMPSQSFVSSSAPSSRPVSAMLRRVFETCKSLASGEAGYTPARRMTREQFFKANPHETDLALLLSRYDREAGMQPHGAD